MGDSTSKAATAKLFGTAPTKRTSSAKPAAKKRSARSTEKAGGAERGKAKPAAPPNRGNSLGKGFYRYKGGVAKKVSAYLDPDVALGLRLAATSGVDARGEDMSEIVNTLLRDAGYVADLPKGYLEGLEK